MKKKTHTGEGKGKDKKLRTTGWGKRSSPSIGKGNKKKTSKREIGAAWNLSGKIKREKGVEVAKRAETRG